MRLANKVAVITGAASGMGRASAILFAKEGARVVVADVNDRGGEETVSVIKAQNGEAIYLHTDVTKAADVENLIKTTASSFGRIDIYFNNAGMPQKSAPIQALDEAEWDKVYAVNTKAVFFGAKYVVPEMRRVGGGAIIITSSVVAIAIRPYQAAYASSKGAAITLAKALALELARYRIRVNCITPGATETPMLPAILPDGVSIEKAKPGLIEGIPLGRLIQPEDVAQAALFLASDEASIISGVTLGVDGARGLH